MGFNSGFKGLTWFHSDLRFFHAFSSAVRRMPG